MPGLIVVIPVFLQHPAQRHAARDEQQIGGQDHQDHRHKEQRHGLQRLLNGHCHDVGHRQQHRAQYGHEQIALGGLFAVALAAQQGHGGAAAHLHHGAQQNQQEDGQIDHHCLCHDGGLYRKGKGRLRLHGGTQPQLHGEGQPHTDADAHCQRDDGGHHRLNGAQQRQVPLAQAQHMVQAEFPLPPPDQKGVGIVEKQRREHGDHPGAQSQNDVRRAAALHIAQQVAVTQLAHHIVHGHHAHAGQQIRQIQLSVLADTGPGQTDIEAHWASPPVVSAVSAPEIRW